MRPPSVLRRLQRRLGVRVRSALAASLVVAVASVLAGGVLLIVARGILLDNVTAAATDRAGQVAVALAGGNLPSLTVAPGKTVVQVVNPAGQVVAASAAITGAPPMSVLRPRAGRRAWET